MLQKNLGLRRTRRNPRYDVFIFLSTVSAAHGASESHLQRLYRITQSTWGYGEYASTPGYYLNGFQPY